MRADRPINLSRRQTLVGATLTFGALWTTLVLPNGASAQGVLSWTPRALTADQARTLDVVAELIIPATDTPGAREAGVPQFVDRAIANWSAPGDAKALRDGLTRMDADARAAHGASFAAITPIQQTNLLTRYDAEATRPAPGARHFFSTLKELATVGYFTSEPGATKAVRYDPVPGDYRSCVLLSEIGRAWAT